MDTNSETITVKEAAKTPEKWIDKRVMIATPGGRFIIGFGQGHAAPTSPVTISGITDRSVTTYARDTRVLVVGETDEMKAVTLYLNDEATLSLNIPEVHREDKEKTAALVVAREVRHVRYHDYIGADPEVFAVTRDGELLPAFEFLPSADEAANNARHEFDEDEDDDTPVLAYWDGYQAEFSFPARTCMDGLTGSVGEGLYVIAYSANKKGAKLSVKTTFDVPLERLESDDPQFTKFGCTPSRNAYGEKIDLPNGRDVPFRSSGGHMHFSMPSGSKDKNIPLVVKELDRVLGVICVALFQKYDDPRRRMFYGRAGEYRTPRYGFEYRVLSSAWMLTPGLTQFVYEVARHVIGQVQKGGQIKWWDVSEDEARQCINETNVGLAQQLLARNNSALLGLLCGMPAHACTSPYTAAQRMVEVIHNGVHTALRLPDEYDWSDTCSEEYPDTDYRPMQWSSALARLEKTGKLS